MKLVVASAISLVALFADLRSADACSPAPTCGDELCRAPDAIVQATLQRGTDLASANARATLRLESVHGDAAELTAGTEVTLSAPWTFGTAEIGKTFLVYLDRDTSNTLVVSSKIDPAGWEVAECFGAGATTKEIADVVLAPTCSTLLDGSQRQNPALACVGPSGPFGCSTGGGAGGAAMLLVVLGLVAVRRRRA